MSIQIINNGDTGLKARNTLNSSARAVQMAAGGRTAIIDAFGDSIGQLNAYGIGGALRAAAWYWAPGLNIRTRTAYSVSGSVSGDILATQLPAFQAAIAGGTPLPDICMIQTHSNDFFNAGGALSLAQNQITLANTLLDMGVPLVIIGSALPKTNGGSQSGRMEINSILRRFADLTSGVVFFDWFSQAVDPNAPTASAFSPWNPVFEGYSTDGVHPSGGATFFAGKMIADMLTNIVGKVQPRTMANIRYANTNADTRWDNLLGPEGNFQGNGGQLNGVVNAGVAGTANTQNNRWQITSPAGVTVTPSIVTEPNGHRKQRMVISGTPSADGTILLNYNHNLLPITAALFERQAILDFTDIAGVRNFNALGMFGPRFDPPPNGVFPTHSGRWFVRDLNPVEISSVGGANYGVQLEVRNGVPVSGTIDVSRCCVFQVPVT